MGKRPGRPRKGELADKSVHPEPEPRHSPPPMDEREEWTYAEKLDSDCRLVVAQRFPTEVAR